MPMKPTPERVSRADLLAEITSLPSSAFINTALAAAYIGTSAAAMMNWRSQRRGPRYHGTHEFIRYRISDLDQWMSARADEISEIEAVSA
jgi:hypothetical protein